MYCKKVKNMYHIMSCPNLVLGIFIRICERCSRTLLAVASRRPQKENYTLKFDRKPTFQKPTSTQLQGGFSMWFSEVGFAENYSLSMNNLLHTK